MPDEEARVFGVIVKLAVGIIPHIIVYALPEELRLVAHASTTFFCVNRNVAGAKGIFDIMILMVGP
jgi:hypothetical protein